MAIAYVTAAKGIDTYDGTTGTTQASASWNLANTNRLIVVGIRWASTTSGISISSVVDTAGNTYVDSGVGRLTLASSVGYAQMYYCKATTATNATNVVTVTFSSATDYKSVIVAEYSGADTSAPLDVTASGTNASAASVTSGSFTPTTASQVAVAIGAHGPAETGTYTAGTNYTKRDVTTANAGDHLVLEDRLSAPASAQTAGLTNTSTFWHGIIVATFKPSGITLVSSTSAGSTVANTSAVTTGSIDTTGATLLVVVACLFDVAGVASGDLTDSAGNTWTLDGQQVSSGNNGVYVAVWRKASPTTSATHTFTITHSTGFPSVIAYAFAGITPATYSHVSASSGSQAGSIGAANDLVVEGIGYESTSGYSIDSSFATPIEVAFLLNNHMGVAASWKQVSGAVNPAWSVGGTNNAGLWALDVAAAAAGGAAVIAAFVLPLLGVQ